VHPDSPVPTVRAVPAPTPDTFALDGDDVPPDPSQSRAVAFSTVHGGRDAAGLGARAYWAGRLEALVAAEVHRAVQSGGLTDAEAEVLIAHLEVVIDQALPPNSD
jgi:hypothetical protein